MRRASPAWSTPPNNIGPGIARVGAAARPRYLNNMQAGNPPIRGGGRALPLFVLVTSAIVMATVLLAQYWGGLAPCELCLTERWPWDVAIVIAFVATMVGSRAALPWVTLSLAAVFIVGSALSFYHVGVEQHWFAGPSACAAAGTPTTLGGAEGAVDAPAAGALRRTRMDFRWRFSRRLELACLIGDGGNLHRRVFRRSSERQAMTISGPA